MMTIEDRLKRIEELCERDRHLGTAERAMFESINESLEEIKGLMPDTEDKEYIIMEQDGYIHHLENMLEKANKKIKKLKKKIKRLEYDL